MKCNQCEYLFINGVGCHETRCPNMGKKLVYSDNAAKPYVGIRKGTSKRVFFVSRLVPSPHYYPEFGAVIGPFKTRRAARWAAVNPCNWSHVSEAEQLSKK